jgi:hypothetical protein
MTAEGPIYLPFGRLRDMAWPEFILEPAGLERPLATLLRLTTLVEQ